MEETPGMGPESPAGSVTPPIALPDIQRAGIPQVGNLPRADVASWIKDLMDKAPDKVNKIAIETSGEIINQLIGAEVNNSSISAIVNDLSTKNRNKYYGN